MSKREFQSELNDELLSAYLDDELSAEERAVVDARLANDSEARQLLHQLRAVSQSVQMLPLEGVGRDLSEEILRRAEAAKSGGSVAADSAATPMGNVPEIRIFGSRRSWFWASLAVAAGLMIMALHLGDEKGNKLPQLAQRDRERSANRSLDERKTAPVTSAGESVEVAKTNGPTPNVAPSDKLAFNGVAAGTPDAPSIGGGGRVSGESSKEPAQENFDRVEEKIAVGSAARAPSNLTLGVSGGSQTDVSKIADSSSASASGTMPAAKPSAVGGSLTPGESSARSDALVVIRVVAKPEAFRSRAFDKVLADHQVKFESTNDADIVVDELRQKSIDQPARKEVAGREIAAADRVIVEAPEDTVAACLADLEQDTLKYVSVTIERPTNAAPEVAHEELAKHLEQSLTRFGRSRAIKDEQSSQTRTYAMNEANKSVAKDKVAPDSKVVANSPAAPSANNEQLRRSALRAESGGRALRLLSSDRDRIDSSEVEPLSGRIGGRGLASRHAEAEYKSTNERATNVRVLFIVSPESER